MIKSFYTIGKILSQDETYSEYFEPWANPFPKVKGDEAKVIFAEINDGILQDSLSEEVFSRNKVNSYLFREAKSRSTNLVPTFYLQVSSDEKTYRKSVNKMIDKVRASVKNYRHTFINNSTINTIEKKLFEYFPKLDLKKQYLFTLKLDNKYFGDFEDYKNLFRDEAYRKYYKDSSSKDKVCAITYKQSDEVWGRVDTLGFTVDAVSFSRNGFEVKDSYKMFPVSPEAVKILEGAKRIIIDSDLNLTRNFYGLKYFILPHFIVNDDELITRVIANFFDTVDKDTSFEGEGESIIYNEKLIHRITEQYELQDSVYYDIFFYQPNNAQFLIKLHLSDILPSRFKEIFDIKKRIEEQYKLLNRVVIKAKNAKSSDTVLNYTINFGGRLEKNVPPMYGIKEYFSQKVRTDTIFHPYFYKVLEAVFYGNSLNKETVLKAFMEKIVHAFKNVKENPNDFDRHVKTSFTLYQFFTELGLFNDNKMENTTEGYDKVSFKLDEFVNQHKSYFIDEEPAKKGAFYLGCLTTKMLFVQKNYYKFQKPYQEPFLKYLQNINFNLDDLRKISVKLKTFQKYQSVLENYDLNEISDLEARVKVNLFDTNLSRTELSYAFTLGMTMQREFTFEAIRKAKENKENNKDL